MQPSSSTTHVKSTRVSCTLVAHSFLASSSVVGATSVGEMTRQSKVASRTARNSSQLRSLIIKQSVRKQNDTETHSPFLPNKLLGTLSFFPHQSLSFPKFPADFVTGQTSGTYISANFAVEQFTSFVEKLQFTENRKVKMEPICVEVGRCRRRSDHSVCELVKDCAHCFRRCSIFRLFRVQLDTQSI